MANVAGGTVKNGTIAMPCAQAVVSAEVPATVQPTIRSVHRAIFVYLMMMIAFVSLIVVLTRYVVTSYAVMRIYVKNVWTTSARYAEATRASAVIMERV